MSDLTFDLADYNHGGMVIQADRRHVQFRVGKRLDKAASDAAGRPIFIQQTLFCVRHPGERDETVVEATEFHKITHPRQWRAFEEGRQADAEGTPLAVLFPSAPEIVEHLRGMRVFTVEMLADISEEGLRRLGMGAREWKQKAQALMDKSAASAPMREMEAELQKRDAEIDVLKAQVALLIDNARQQAAQPSPQQPARRGRAAAQPSTQDFDGAGLAVGLAMGAGFANSDPPQGDGA